MTPFEQIDFVFLYIKEHTQHGGSIGYHNIENRVKATPETEITITMLKEILKRLEDDGHIIKEIPNNNQPIYHLAFEVPPFTGYVKSGSKIAKTWKWFSTHPSWQFWSVVVGIFGIVMTLFTCNGERSTSSKNTNDTIRQQKTQPEVVSDTSQKNG